MELEKYDKKKFLKKMFIISLPIAMHNFIFSLQNLVDVIMIGKLGKEELAGVGFANQLFFILMLLLFGLYSGAATFIAQYWGSKDIKSIHRIMGISLIVGLMLSTLGYLSTQFWAEKLLKIYSTDMEVVQYGAQYLKILGKGFIIMSIAFCYAVALRSTGNPYIPMYASLIAVLINIFLNYALIFGNLNFPRLGVRGAAIATLVSRYVDFIVLFTILVLAKLKVMMNFDTKFILNFFRISSPVMFQEVLWVLGINTYFMIYGTMGTNTAATINVTLSFERLSFVMFFGMASASAVMIGNEIGKGNQVLAYDYAKRFLKIGPIMAIVFGVIFLLLRDPIISIYNVDPEIYDLTKKTITVMLCIFPIKVFNLTNVIGILRSGGDSKAAFLLDVVPMWTLGVPLCYLSGIILNYPIYIVLIFIGIEELIKMFFGIHRFRSKKWIKNLVREKY